MNKNFDSVRISQKEKLALISIDIKARYLIFKCKSKTVVMYFSIFFPDLCVRQKFQVK